MILPSRQVKNISEQRKQYKQRQEQLLANYIKENQGAIKFEASEASYNKLLEEQQNLRQQSFEKQIYGIYNLKDGIIDEYNTNSQEILFFTSDPNSFRTQIPQTINFKQFSNAGVPVSGILLVQEATVIMKIGDIVNPMAANTRQVAPMCLYLTVTGTSLLSAVNEKNYSNEIVAILNPVTTSQTTLTTAYNTFPAPVPIPTLNVHYILSDTFRNKPILLNSKNQFTFDLKFWDVPTASFVSISTPISTNTNDPSIYSSHVNAQFKFTIQ